MKEVVNFGIGFFTGRPNVCSIINSYYNLLLEQFEESKYEVKITCFILFDMEYLSTERKEFYNIEPEVYKNINIKYISPENIDEERKKFMTRFELSEYEANLILGNNYAKARNTIMYYALRAKMDYLLFWDDDEYPVANIKDENGDVSWIKQNNLLEHFKGLKNANVTTGFRCGFMAPLPMFEYTEDLNEEDFKKFIYAVSNEAFNWDTVCEMKVNPSSISYASEDIATAKASANELLGIGKDTWVLGSGLALNLKKLEILPAFYNPEGARGEDAFFATALAKENAKVVQVPTYHFHDSFLRYTNILKEKYPKNFKRLNHKDGDLVIRFRKACIGWMKYKPLLIYITEREKYEEIIIKVRAYLEETISKINKVFPNYNFDILLNELNEYDKNVEKHYEEYLKTTEVWNKIKEKMLSE